MHYYDLETGCKTHEVKKMRILYSHETDKVKKNKNFVPNIISLQKKQTCLNATLIVTKKVFFK